VTVRKDGKVLTPDDYIDMTSKHQLENTMLNEIALDTWYGDRSDLLGDGKSKGPSK